MLFVDFPQPGGPEVLCLAEAPKPEPGDGEVLIRVEAAGVNRPDLLQRQGKYPPPAGASPVLGLEVAGTIEAAPRESRWKRGDRVCALVPGGGYAEYCKTPESHCLPVPEGLTIEEAAGIPETYFTVWANVFQIGELKQGERLLVHGGTSGIGTTAIQLARAFGATVFVTAGSEAKCAACLKLGAAGAINYLRQDFVHEIRALTPHGVDVVLDIVGGPYTPRNIECLVLRGRLVQIAVQQGAETTINLAKVMQKRLIITGSTMRPRSVADKAQIAHELESQVWPLLAAGQVKVIVDRVFPFAEAAEAHRYLENGAHIGKVILKLT
jgi:putative PIG3 family NAD(P)H quinone oxidoreductase